MKAMETKQKRLGCIWVFALLAVVWTHQECCTLQEAAHRRVQTINSVGLNESSVVVLRNMTGTWMGNSWIAPPPWRQFSVQDMQDLYHDRKVIWIGDSTARRAGMTLFSVLNATASLPVSVRSLEQDIDVNKLAQTESCDKWHKHPVVSNDTAYPEITVCRRVRDHQGEVTHAWAQCVGTVQSILQAELRNNCVLLSEYQVVIISMGIWHDVMPGAFTMWCLCWMKLFSNIHT